MSMEASAGGSKPAAAKHVLHGVWRHVLIDLFLAEFLLAVFFVARLPIPVRPVRLDAADFTSLTVRESTGTWPAQSLTLTEREEIAAHCAAFHALCAPRERHPARYRVLGGTTYEFLFTRADGGTFAVRLTGGTPLLCVQRVSTAAPRYYHVGKETVERLCADAAALLDPVGGAG